MGVGVITKSQRYVNNIDTDKYGIIRKLIILPF